MKNAAKHRRTIVFDLDGTLETPYYSEDQAPKVIDWVKDHPCGCDYEQLHVSLEACGKVLPHFILPGVFELLRWVHDHGFEIVFFSNAVVERNKALCPILMERAFGGDAIPPYRIFSREDCVDTQHMEEEKRLLYDGLWHGNYKKKLAGVVVPEEDLPDTLMVEDDNSYACRGEEQNFVYGVYGGSAANYLNKPELSSSRGHDFHLPFYFCGMLKRIVDCAEKEGISLVDASRKVQYEDDGHIFPSDGCHRTNLSGKHVEVPMPPRDEYRVYLDGLNELRKYNPDLKFWDAATEERYYWPIPPAKPLPPPEPEKPKTKTDMTMDEANYWMCVLRTILCAITESNVKSVRLDSSDWRNSPYGGEDRWAKFRHEPFRDDGEWFDVKEVTHVSLYGYLPVPRKEDKSKRGFCYLEKDEGTKAYEICGQVIRRFLYEVFGLDVVWYENEISNYGENWRMPVRH